MEGWQGNQGLDGLYRLATPAEQRRFHWPEQTLILALPFDILDEGGGTTGNQVWTTLPQWLQDREAWAIDDKQHIIFERHSFTRVQTLALGHFVEHHRSDGQKSGTDIRRPIFHLFGANDIDRGRRAKLLRDSLGGLLIHQETTEGRLELSAPHTTKDLDIQAPLGFQIAIVSPSQQKITRDPLTPFSCENGECEDPNDPLDQCNDGFDNDGDGHSDLCDWNCLPHADYGANAFPEAQSRVENGKSYAMMGGGSICTELGDTWMVNFADWALQASELLGNVRPEAGDEVHFRVFSCWIFEDAEAFKLCQYGPYEGAGEDVDYSPPICPPGLEAYPYKPTDTDQLSDKDQSSLLYDEATRRAWSDLELNTAILGPYGEPVNGTVFLTSDVIQTCKNLDSCIPAAGLATVYPNGSSKEVGRAVVTNYNPNDWHTLAHEVGHTLGMFHDNAFGFMNPNTFQALPVLGTSIDTDNPGIDNNSTWEKAFLSKSSHARSSGWYSTGCSDVEDACAPLGKPGWSCNNIWCVPD